MKNKVLLSVLLGAFFVSNIFAGKDCDITKISEPEETYYKEGREWEYLERILIKNIDRMESKTNGIVNNTSTLIATVIFFVVGAGAANDNDIKGVAGKILAGLASGGISAGVVKLVSMLTRDCCCDKKIKKERFVNVLEKFLQKYNPDKDLELDGVNYKNIIPEELNETFDALHKKYSEFGKNYLTENSIEILESITDEIRYEIKSNKYKELSKQRRAAIKNISGTINAVRIEQAIRERK
ncbi:MAG: hypothetical protein SZ59_C0003G0080 [candidate division TM6 bacterium GW2011_GWF2_28_16]|jgi:hypothetical protein|nr:MAG: hypothetical protein SZ59_C0003G0080 [candidate division TM6 bacterium GW2011_GWF2_28_16]